MPNPGQPYIADDQNLPEMTLKVWLLSIALTMLLSAANCYLALKIGMLTSASIPAAVIAMGLLRCFKKTNILQTNLVQTAASAGEAVAGGIVYTIPAMLLIGYWQSFSYWLNFVIAASSGLLGVCFSIPLRRWLMRDETLSFPEGQAITEVMVLGETHSSRQFRAVIGGSLAGGLLELAQTGFKLLASSWQMWWHTKRSLVGFGTGFSPAMLGAGFLIGIETASSIFIGAMLTWLIAVPIFSALYASDLQAMSSLTAVAHLWQTKLRYLGIGAMLVAGCWTLLGLLKPLWQQWQMHAMTPQQDLTAKRTEQDIPNGLLLTLIAFGLAALAVLLVFTLPIWPLGFSKSLSLVTLMASLLYCIVVGFLFAALTAYFSGMVGVSASPGSAIIIAGLLAVSLMLKVLLQYGSASPNAASTLLAAQAVTILLSGIVTGMAAIANDNMQDLRVGYLLGATPWKQQVMLLVGVFVSAAVIPLAMQILYQVYGIGSHLPHPHMDPLSSLPAPPAAMLAAVTSAVFAGNIPWVMMLIGALLMISMIVLQRVLRAAQQLSILGVAVGMYLPLTSSTPLFLGGVMAWFCKKRAPNAQAGMLIACGLVAGAAIVDVLLAIPFALLHGPDALQIVGDDWLWPSIILSLLAVMAIGRWMLRESQK